MGAVDSRQTKAKKKKKKLLDPGERPLIFGFCSLFRVPRTNVDSSCIPGSLRAPLGSLGFPGMSRGASAPRNALLGGGSFSLPFLCLVSDVMLSCVT